MYTYTFRPVNTMTQFHNIHCKLTLDSLPRKKRAIRTTMTDTNSKKAMLPRTPPTIAAVLSRAIGEKNTMYMTAVYY